MSMIAAPLMGTMLGGGTSSVDPWAGLRATKPSPFSGMVGGIGKSIGAAIMPSVTGYISSSIRDSGPDYVDPNPQSPTSLLMEKMQGEATMLSVVAGLDAADREAESFGFAADDAEEEAHLEALSGIERRASLKRQAYDAVGKTALAFAAGGQDASFGSPVQARSEAFRELDGALEADNFTQKTRVSRLKERAGEYRRKARTVKAGAKTKAKNQWLQHGISQFNRG